MFTHKNNNEKPANREELANFHIIFKHTPGHVNYQRR